MAESSFAQGITLHERGESPRESDASAPGIRRAGVAKSRFGLAFEAGAKLFKQARLADTRFANDLDNLPLARHGQPPTVQEQLELKSAAGESGCVADGPQRLEPALGRALADDTKHSHRDLEPVHNLGRAFDHFEQTDDESAGELRNQNGAGLGERLYACGQVRSFADHGLLLGGTRANKVAHN